MAQFPALILTYLGQAAYLTTFPENINNTFYASMPGKPVRSQVQPLEPLAPGV